MHFLVDECAGPRLAQWLREQGHDVFSVYEQARGMEDDFVIRRAFAEQRILITNDKDFGEKIFRAREPHSRVILLRLDDERAQSKIQALERLLAGYADRLPNHFTVISETKIRISSQHE